MENSHRNCSADWSCCSGSSGHQNNLGWSKGGRGSQERRNQDYCSYRSRAYGACHCGCNKELVYCGFLEFQLNHMIPYIITHLTKGGCFTKP